MTTAGSPELALTQWRRPTPWSHGWFVTRVWLLRLRRMASDLVRGPRRLQRGDAAAFTAVCGQSLTRLMGDRRPAEEEYQLGKIINLRRAAASLDGLVLPAGATFSFWRQVGPATSTRGFVVGRMLQQGCLVPAVGGGLCQLSNALYDVALQAGCEIIERHGHSRVVPGSDAESGRDATVAWNYVDLRFRSSRPLRLDVRLENGVLEVSLTGRLQDGGSAKPVTAMTLLETPLAHARSCATCDEVKCFRHEKRQA